MVHLQNEEKNKKIGMSVSVVLHALILLFLIRSILTFPTPPPGQEGILVSFGTPDLGAGDDMPDTQQDEMVKPEEPATPPEDVEEVIDEPVPDEVVEDPQPEDTAPDPAPEDVTPTETQDAETSQKAEAVAIKKAKEQEAKLKKEKEAADAAIKAQKKADEIAKKKAKEAKDKADKIAAQKAKEKAAADKKAYEAKKKQFGDMFGKGKGNKGKAGNQGDPNGDPNSDNLDGVSTGTGNIGGGLGGRGVLKSPKVSDSSQETGKIVLKVCVDSNGNVIKSRTKYTAKGSTSSSLKLQKIAIRNANRYKFSAGDRDIQCGTITYDFKLK